MAELTLDRVTEFHDNRILLEQLNAFKVRCSGI